MRHFPGTTTRGRTQRTPQQETTQRPQAPATQTATTVTSSCSSCLSGVPSVLQQGGWPHGPRLVALQDSSRHGVRGHTHPPQPRQPPKPPQARGRYTRSEKVHCLRIGRTAPTHKNKRGADRTSPLPTTTSPSIGHQADLLSPIDAAPPRASSWACAQVVDGLFMRLLSRPLGVFRFR